MQRNMLSAKLHRVTVTQADLNYVGSVTIDATLLDAARMLPGEKVDVVDVTNGNRLTTYAIEGEAGTGQICINGAAAHLIQPGDIAIIIAYSLMDEVEARTFVPRVVFVDHDNHIVDIGGDPSFVPDGFGLEASGTPRRSDTSSSSGRPGSSGTPEGSDTPRSSGTAEGSGAPGDSGTPRGQE